VRLELRGKGEDDQNAAVLAHEITHVCLDQLSEFRLSPHFPSVRFFHEGLASYVEHRFFRKPEELKRFRSVAAVAHAWGPVSFDMLADDGSLSRKRYRELVYPFGELFCAALVRCYGDDACSRVARTFARAHAPKGLEHTELWQETLQTCGYSLEAVLAQFYGELDRVVKEERAFIESLPRLRATTETVGEELVIRPTFTGTAPGKLVCICRPTPDAADYEYDFPPRQEDGSFRVRRSAYERGRMSYQLGWHMPDLKLPLFEAWEESTR
jgi:hypothetical protein